MKIEEHTGQDAIGFFNQLRPWIERVLINSANYSTIGDVWRMLAEERATLLLGYSGFMVGFAFAEPLHTAFGPWINIPFAYCESELDYNEFFDEIGKMADERGMAGVKFISYRKGFEKLAEKHGWERGYTEYIVKDFRGR